jgi:hypothetical protein
LASAARSQRQARACGEHLAKELNPAPTQRKALDQLVDFDRLFRAETPVSPLVDARRQCMHAEQQTHLPNGGSSEMMTSVSTLA